MSYLSIPPATGQASYSNQYQYIVITKYFIKNYDYFFVLIN